MATFGISCKAPLFYEGPTMARDRDSRPFFVTAISYVLFLHKKEREGGKDYRETLLGN